MRIAHFALAALHELLSAQFATDNLSMRVALFQATLRVVHLPDALRDSLCLFPAEITDTL